MKKLAAILLVLLLIGSAFGEELPTGLQMEIKNMYIADEWNDETSETHDWLAVDVTITNWNVTPVQLEEYLTAQLCYMDIYNFDAQLVFYTVVVEPLVQLDGTLLFRIPKMVAADTQNAELSILLNDETISPDIDVGIAPLTTTKGRYECEGFDSPEEALMAYVNAFNAGNANAMVSTFAIETHVDNADRQALIERLYAFMYTSSDSCPMPNEYTRELLVGSRFGELYQAFYLQFLTYAWPEEYGVFEYKPVRFMNSDTRSAEARAFLDSFAETEFAPWAGEVEIIEFLSPEDLGISDTFYMETNQKNIQRFVKCYGCDELAYPTLHIRINGKDYVQFMECARYGERWYNNTPHGNLANLAGVNSGTGGLVSMEYLTESE